MKKYLISIILCIITGFIMGLIMFRQYDNTKTVSSIIGEKAYFFQGGVYTDIDNMKEASKNYDSYIYIKEDDKYYVYLAMTFSLENKTKLEGYFSSLKYDIYVKEIEIDNIEFIDKLRDYDNLLKEANDNETIKSIINNTLKAYEEVNHD